VRVANLDVPRFAEAKKNPAFRDNWDVVKQWSEQSRYRRYNREIADTLLKAISDPKKRSDGMAKTILVTADFTAGLEILQALDRSTLSISVALWLYSSEHEDWRFVLASRRLDAVELTKAYGLVHDALSAAGIPLEKTPSLMILEMSDPFIRALRRLFSKTQSVEGMRLGLQMIGDRFVQDALVYRVR
jgi:hypothetical protein